MQHDLDGRLRRVVLVAFAPVVRDGIGENVARLAKCGRNDAAADIRIAL